MDHNERMRLIASELNDFLRRFKRPDHLDNDQAMLEIKATCTAMNKRMESGLDKIAMIDRLGDAFQDVCENFRGTGWPKTAVFVTSMENLAKRRPAKIIPFRQADAQGPAAIIAKRMNDGGDVGDDWLYGRLCIELMATGAVDQDTLRKYRSALYFSMKDTWGEADARKYEDALIERHEAATRWSDSDTGKRYSAPTYTPRKFGGAA